MRLTAADWISILSESDLLWPAGVLRHALLGNPGVHWYQLRRQKVGLRPHEIRRYQKRTNSEQKEEHGAYPKVI